MNPLAWLLFGIMISIVAHLVDPSDEKGGFLGTLMLGILGAMLGGLMANVVVGTGLSGFNVTSFAIAAIGSLLLLFIQRSVRRIEQ